MTDIDRTVPAREAAADRLLTPAEVAARFGVRPKTVASWSSRGLLPSLRTAGGHRRYREEDVEALRASLERSTSIP